MDFNQHFFSDGKHEWLVPDLWEAAKDLPVKEIKVDDLVPWASDADVPQTLFERVAEIRRVLNADLKHPIILTPDGWIADGMHRLTKALLKEHKTVKVIRLATTPQPLDSKRE